MNCEDKPLAGIKVVTLAQNIPGPIAARKLIAMGASVIKIEPPQGDPLATICPSWYRSLCEGQLVCRLDLRADSDHRKICDYLKECDLFLTSIRPSSLVHLSLEWDKLHSRFSRLCQVAIIGYPAPDHNRPGHDLNYLASLGLLSPPHVPSTLLADLAGAVQAVNSALLLLFARERRGISGYAEVSLSESAEIYAEPLRYGLTGTEGIVGGGSPRYNLYETRDGWIAVAALEHHFWDTLTKNLGIIQPDPEYEELRRVFLTKTSREWEEWAISLDIPITAIRNIVNKDRSL